MTSLARVRVGLTGFTGSPGVATFYCSDPVTFTPLLRAFYAGIAGQITGNTIVIIEPSGDIINDVDGALTGSWSATPTASVTGTGAAAYGAPCGALVRWETDFVVDSHRLRGRTFLVPMDSAQMTTSGRIASATVTQIQSFASALVAATTSNFYIWHRPRVAKAATPTSLAVTQRDGASAFVTRSSVPTKVVVLRSRRD